MKALCSIIRDILPLYYDNVCSEESRAMVDEHLKECAECREVLTALGDELTHPADTADEAKPIRIIKEGIEKRKRRSVLKGVIIAVLVCTILAGGYFILTQQRNLSLDNFSTSEAYMLSDGRVVFQHDFYGRVETLLLVGYDGVGTVHIIPRGSIIGNKQTTLQPVYQGLNTLWGVKVYREYIVVDPSGDVTAIYVGFGESEKLMWEQGMELLPASAELELFFQVSDPFLDRNDSGYSENDYAVPAVKDKLWNLTQDGVLTVSADELSEYQLYTNSESISITIPRGDYEGVFMLYDASDVSDFIMVNYIMVMELDQLTRTGTFEHLTAASNYYIVVDNTEPDALITVTD